MDNNQEGLPSPEPDLTIPVKVLIAEDDRSAAKMLSVQIKSANVSVVVVEEGEEALQLLRDAKKEGQVPFDLVISDYGLRGEMNGVDLARVVNEEDLALRFSILSGRQAEDVGMESEDMQIAGISKWLPKLGNTAERGNEVTQVRLVKQDLQGPKP